MDQRGGLEQFRQQAEGKQRGARERPADDEGLPF